MKQLVSSFTRIALGALLTIAAAATTAEEAAKNTTGERATVIEVEARVAAVDLEGRTVTLEAPDGEQFTVHAPETLVKLEDVNTGDVLRVAYISAIAGEVREPTEEELAEPWVELEDAELGELDRHPVAADARAVRAVCTIEGMNRLLGTVTVLDPKGNAHVIGDVDPAKMEGVTLGQTVVIEYLEALAVTLEPVTTE